jgi:hypothetical protein
MQLIHSTTPFHKFSRLNFAHGRKCVSFGLLVHAGLQVKEAARKSAGKSAAARIISLMSISEDNAFMINLLGGGFFPFSAEVSQNEGVWRLQICAQRVLDLCDLLVKHGGEACALFGVGQFSLIDEVSGAALPLSRTAEELGVPARVIDEETIVVPSVLLFKLLCGFSHYELNLFDLPADWTEEQVIRQVLEVQGDDGQGALLARLPASRVFLSSHDDCYLTLESTSEVVPREVFAHTLHSFACALLDDLSATQMDAVELAPDLIESLWGDGFGLHLLRENVDLVNGVLRMGASKAAYDFGNPQPSTLDMWITYDPSTRKWAVDE